MVLWGVEHKESDAVIKTLADTTVAKVAAISIHAAHFAKLVLEEWEKQHERLKVLHVALNVDHI